MAQAYSRVTQGPGVCMAASGPATLNFGTGLANALIDCCPVVALGGSSPISQFGRQVFQEIDQVKALEGCVKYADRVHNLKRMPQQVNFAFQKALNGKPGPVYLDFPGDVLYTTVDEADVDWSYCGRPIIKARPYAEPKALNALVDAINQAPGSRSSSRAAASCGRRPGTRCGPLSRRPGSRSTRPRKGAASSPTTTPIPI